MLVKLEAYHDGAYWCARGIGESVFIQGKTFEELLDNVREALSLHFEEKLEEGETLQVLILLEMEMKSQPVSTSPDIGAPSVDDEQTQHRRALVKHILKLREDIPPLGMTTSELVRLAREERDRFYEK